MGRRGPQPEYAKREAFAELIAEGVASQRASLIVGIHPTTGKRWRIGRKVKSGGRMLDLPPVINPRPEKRYSPLYLSEDERIRLADLRREKLSIRGIATLMDRSPSTISRELQRGSDSAGRYRSQEAHRRALARRRVRRAASRLCQDDELREWVAAKLKARWSPEQISHELRAAFPSQPARWLCTESIYRPSIDPTWAVCPVSCPDECCATGAATGSLTDMPRLAGPGR